MGRIAELLGWLTALTWGLALSNYLVKFFNKHVINKYFSHNKSIVDLYRMLMKIIIRNHRYFGIAAVLAVHTHSTIIFLRYGFISKTGVVAALMMDTLVGLGIYGAYVKKKPTGQWIIMHRTIAGIMVIAISAHLLLKI